MVYTMAAEEANTGTDSDQETLPPESNTPPGPKGLPILGNTIPFVRRPFEVRDEWAEEYGDVVSTRISGYDMVFVNDASQVRRIFIEDRDKFRKGEFYQDSLGDLLGNGILMRQGEDWRKQRAQIQPAFYRDKIEGYVQTMTDYTAERAEGWEDGEVLDIHEEMMELTLDIIVKTMFDEEMRQDRSKVGDAMADITDTMTQGYLPIDPPLWIPTPSNRKYKSAKADLEEIILSLIEDRKEVPEEERGDDLLSMLLTLEDEDGNYMDDKTLRDELLTILLAGHETTALAMTFTWHLLSQNPEEAKPMYDEVDDVLGDEKPSAMDVFEFDYLEHCIEEGMRLRPPVHQVGRETTEPVNINGYYVPEGTTVLLPQWVIHRKEEYWDDPLTFDPSRFEAEDAYPEGAFFPFGMGPRKCIGDMFAMIESQIITSTIARDWKFEHQHELPKLQAGATSRPRDSVMMKAKRRD